MLHVHIAFQLAVMTRIAVLAMYAKIMELAVHIAVNILLLLLRCIPILMMALPLI